MPVRIRSIEYTEHGVNIVGDEVELVTLQDGSTREIKIRGYAAPVGVNDGKDIEAHVAKVLGQAAAKPFADMAVLRAERDELATAYERVVREKRDIEHERNQVRAERDEARNQLLQSKQAEMAARNVGRGK